MLRSIACDKGLTQLWDKTIQPWLKANCSGKESLQVSSTINDHVKASAAAAVDKEKKITGVKDLVTAFDKDKAPWQSKKYSPDNSLWQGAALRRRAHPRRTNTSLGVCSVDLWTT